MEVVYRCCCSLILMLCIAIGGCASNAKVDSTEVEFASEGKTADPLERYNRGAFVFNDKLDGWILKPISIGYRFITPSFVERGVNNFFMNLAEVNGIFNNILQWKWKKVGNNTGRLFINSTIGLAGLFDIAKHTGLERQDPESFGQTLTYWGVGPGPYLVIPLFGPSTLTDAFATPVGWYVNPVAHADIKESSYYNLKILDAVSSRANLLDAEELISGDKYSFIREAYLQRRNFLVNDGEVEDDFGNFDDFDGDF